MKSRILLVDDEAAIRIALKTILEGHGFEVEVAASATEATQKLGEGQFHLIITDLRMETPGAGYEVIRAAREQQYNPAVVILTAYPVAEKDWMAAGAQAMLTKGTGINSSEIVHQIERVLISYETSIQQ